LLAFLIIKSTNAINKCHFTDCIEDDRSLGLTAQGSVRQDPARKAEERHSPEICITCSNIKRPLVWPDNVVVRREIRASRRLSHRFELLLLLVRLVLSLFSPSRSLYAFRSGAFFFLFSSISAAFLTQSSSRSLSTCLGSSLRVKAVVRRNLKKDLYL